MSEVGRGEGSGKVMRGGGEGSGEGSGDVVRERGDAERGEWNEE